MCILKFDPKQETPWYVMLQYAVFAYYKVLLKNKKKRLDHSKKIFQKVYHRLFKNLFLPICFSF